jgi:hypothetical protein
MSARTAMIFRIPNLPWSTRFCGRVGIPDDEYQLDSGPALPDRQRDKPFMD